MPDFSVPRAVVFDLDGLMFNTEELYEYVGCELLRRRRKQLTNPLLDQMMGRRNRVALQIMIDWYDLDDTVLGLEAEADEIFSGILSDRIALMPGLTELMEALEAAGIPKSIATSSPGSFVQTILAFFDFAPRFDFILADEDVQRGKPHPEIYLTAAKRHGVVPAELLALEDSDNGCRAAVQAGTFAVAVPNRHSQGHDFRGASLIVDSLRDPQIYRVLNL